MVIKSSIFLLMLALLLPPMALAENTNSDPILICLRSWSMDDSMRRIFRAWH